MSEPPQDIQALARSPNRSLAHLYDASMRDWPGELEFYSRLVASSGAREVLEIACGTGRMAIRLATDGVRVTGFDSSPDMLDAARRKSAGNASVRWLEADLRTFDLDQTFDLVISPAHSFQYMLTLGDQLVCLGRVRKHLRPGGPFALHVDHPDVAWLGRLRSGKGGAPERGEPITDVHGRRFRPTRTWSYEPATQTRTSETVWEELDSDDRTIDRWEVGPRRLHCYFPSEMEHLFARAGFQVEAVHGDFMGGPLRNDSAEMTWVVTAPASG